MTFKRSSMHPGLEMLIDSFSAEFSNASSCLTTVYGMRSRLLMWGSSFANWVVSPSSRGTLLLSGILHKIC